MGVLDRLRGRPKVRELEGIWLDGYEQVRPVGESHYQDALCEVAGVRPGETCGFDCSAALVAEPENTHDRNAVAVYANGKHVAYLSRQDAIDYQPMVRMCADVGLVVACRAYIAGRGADARTPNLGVFLHLPRPDDAVMDLQGRL